jgi:REase_AHJR-like
MTFEERLNYVVERYKEQGYQVVVRPGPEALPPFARDFKVEILATRDDGGVLVSAKESPSKLEADPSVARYADVTNQQPGWRFDLFILGSDIQPGSQQEAREPEEEEIRRSLDAVEQMLRAGFVKQSLVAAWATLEAAMRRRLQAEGEVAGWGTSPRTMLNELYSAGAISTGVLRQLEGIAHLRNAMVHGFSTAAVVDASSVLFLVETARRLLTESQPAKQTA